MTAKYYTLLTEVGAAKLANATALGVPLKLTHMAVGDGGGTLPTPNSKQVALVAEKRRAALNSLSIDPQNASQIIAEQVIPESEGGWWVREIGLFDDAGDLIAIGNCPESYKPQLAEGSGRTQTVRMVLITSSTDNITLKIDPSVVLATRGYVDNQIETRQQKSDVLTAMAGVKPAKGKLPYFTGDKAAAVADLSDFIRLMLNKGDAAGVLEYLGLRNVPHSQMASYLTAGTFTFTVPDGVYRIKCRVIGGGGGAGGSASAKSGGGGGAGGYAEGWIDVTPGQTITITVGAGGQGGTAGNFGVSGGLSSVGGFMSASGGAYGDAGGGGTGAGGFGGTGTGGSVNSVGSDGSDGTTTGAVGAGAGGGSALGGSTRSGGSGRNSLSIGGGGSASYTTAAQSGGNGHAGAVILEY